MIKYDTISEKGYAKINLHLDITGRLDGGYHSVVTVMQTVSICDDVTISQIRPAEGESRFFVSCDAEGVPCDGRNLAVKAAMAFCERAGVKLNAHIDIKKNIPMAAGMAGGSADGAAVLRGLNRVLGAPLTTEELCEIGAALGADIPFCVVGGTAYADGKGDRLKTISEMPDCVIVAACEGEGVSTPWAYRLLDDTYGGFYEDSGYTPRPIDGLMNALASGDPSAVATNMYNVFEAPVLAERPVAAGIKSLMLEGGAIGAMMSGSGPSVFSVFACERRAEAVATLLQNNGYRAYICRPVGVR